MQLHGKLSEDRTKSPESIRTSTSQKSFGSVLVFSAVESAKTAFIAGSNKIFQQLEKKSAIIFMFIPYLDERMSNFKSNCSLQAANPSCVYAPIVCKLHLFPIELADCHSVQSIATRHVLNLHNN